MNQIRLEETRPKHTLGAGLRTPHQGRRCHSCRPGLTDCVREWRWDCKLVRSVSVLRNCMKQEIRPSNGPDIIYLRLSNAGPQNSVLAHLGQQRRCGKSSNMRSRKCCGSPTLIYLVLHLEMQYMWPSRQTLFCRMGSSPAKAICITSRCCTR